MRALGAAFSPGEPEETSFPLALHDKTVRALHVHGHHDLSNKLSYELGAQKGNHVCNHFNAAAGVSPQRRADIDLNRRADAHERVGLLKAQAIRLLGFDPETRDNNSGGAPKLTL